MEKKEYTEPAVTVVKLHYQRPLLSGSSEYPGKTGVNNYSWHTEADE